MTGWRPASSVAEVREALLDKLEELEDVEDLKTLLCEPTRPLSEILKDLKLDGKL